MNEVLRAIKDWCNKKFQSKRNFLERLANNCFTTEEGFGLDARQGTVLQGEIDEIYSKLDKYDHTKVINDGTNCTDNKYWNVERIGKQVNMFGRVYLQSLEASSWYTIGYLPDGYKPNITHSNCLFSITSEGALIECNITNAGEITIRPNSKITKEGWFPFTLMTWFTEDDFPTS